MKLGVISDTHNLLRPEALEALQGSDYIIHAGDIGAEDIIPALEEIAPVTAIRGNIDREQWVMKYPEDEVVDLETRLIYVIHDENAIRVDPVKEKFDMIISGHSHIPMIEEKNGIIYLNPGSAGPRRFVLPITIAKVDITAAKIVPEIIHLSLAN